MLFQVNIQECGGRRRSWTTRVRADDKHDAEVRGVKKLFGQRAYLHPDNGLPAGYGQIVQNVTGPGEMHCASCVTGRVYVEVSR